MYKYDGSGNLLQKRVYPRTEENKGKSTAALNAAPSAEEKTYTYMTTGSRDRLRSYNGSGEITYDMYGNAETWFKHGENSRIGLELSRDRHGRLTKITDTETGEVYAYGYDGNGLRESKTAQGITHTYRYIGEKLAEEIRSDGKKLRYYYDDAGLRTIGYESGGAERVYRVRRNVQGDVEKLVDASGTVVVEYVYDAWGNHTVHDTSGEGLGTLNSIRYRGYIYDTETGLYYLQSRYYDPEVGRFLSADSIEYLDPETINGLNLYAYCGNNPVNRWDPTGHFVISLLVGLAVSFVIGTSASAISQYVQYGEVNLLQAGIDGLFAVISTALAYTGIGLIGSIVAGAGLGFAQYVVDSAIFHNDFTWSGALIATGLGALGGLASGRGAQHFKSIGSNLDDTGRTGVKAILTAFDRYGTGAGYQKVLNLWGGRVANSLAKSISQNFTKSALIIWGTTATTYGASYWLGKINWGF